MLWRQWKQYRNNREYWNTGVPYSFTLPADEENKMNSRGKVGNYNLWRDLVSLFTAVCSISAVAAFTYRGSSRYSNKGISWRSAGQNTHENGGTMATVIQYLICNHILPIQCFWKILIWRPGRRCECYNRTNVEEMGWRRVEKPYLAHGRNNC
jgi:hypothetical protein